MTPRLSLPQCLLPSLCCLVRMLTPPLFRPSATRAPASPCRRDMAVRRLPPMSADDRAVISDLMTYLTRPDGGTCRKKLKFGGLPVSSFCPQKCAVSS